MPPMFVAISSLFSFTSFRSRLRSIVSRSARNLILAASSCWLSRERASLMLEVNPRFPGCEGGGGSGSYDELRPGNPDAIAKREPCIG